VMATSNPSKPVSSVAALVFVVYVLAAVAVHHCWPFYVFDMYAFAAPSSTSRVTLVDDQGRLIDVRDVTEIRCDGDPRGTLYAGSCAQYWTVAARDDEVWQVLERHRLTGTGTGAWLVRYGWRWSNASNALPAVTACARVRCEVRL